MRKISNTTCTNVILHWLWEANMVSVSVANMFMSLCLMHTLMRTHYLHTVCTNWIDPDANRLLRQRHWMKAIQSKFIVDMKLDIFVDNMRQQSCSTSIAIKYSTYRSTVCQTHCKNIYDTKHTDKSKKHKNSIFSLKCYVLLWDNVFAHL